MNHRLRYSIILFLLFQVISFKLIAQQENPPFWDEIQAFKKEDSIHPPPKNAILFVGSSSFNFWKSVQKDFPGYRIINRGFGGSSLPDVIRYQDDIIYPYQPKQIVIYCGENDLAMSDTVNAEIVTARFMQLFNSIRQKLPKVPILFVSIKPSPSRQHLMARMVEANNKIKSFLQKQRNTSFIDVYHKMLNPDGTPKKEIFIEDNLHMNAKGYSIWQKSIKPYLLK
jgi:lysophospholipase L1-like esterase